VRDRQPRRVATHQRRRGVRSGSESNGRYDGTAHHRGDTQCEDGSSVHAREVRRSDAKPSQPFGVMRSTGSVTPLARVKIVSKIDGFQQRHRWASFPLAVVYKYGDDQGGYLAALITYYGFLSLFPGLLLLVTTLGYVLADNPEAQQKILDSAFGNFPVIGTQLEHNITSLHGSPVALVVGALGLLYGVLGVGQAGQLAFNRAWAIPRNERPNPIKSRVRSFAFVLVVGLGLIITTFLTGLGSSSGYLSSHAPNLVRGFVIAASVVTNIGVFFLAFRLLTARVVVARDLIPGAVVAAFGWQILQALGTTYLTRVIAHSSDIYGVFGIVLGLVAWIYLGATVTVFAAEVNVVRACRLWPRSLLAPFADNLPITAADERAYASYAEMRKFKSFQQVDVRFDDPRQRRSRH
jgi:membrane protein